MKGYHMWNGLMKRFLAAALACASVLIACGVACAAETAEEFAARTRWWQDARFGMFIHWGLYAVPADSTKLDGSRGVGEWYLMNRQVTVRDYEKFAAEFNPVKFDAAAWVRAAKDAGMKYIVITSKHHDGFCLFDSKLTWYTITRATSFKRDPIRELADECAKQGITLCFYHSIMDWHHPDYVPRRAWDKRPDTRADLNRYIDYMKGQIRELLTNYGPIGILWFDGAWEHNEKDLRSAEVNAFIRSLQPAILINDRNRLPEDYATPEQKIPAGAMPDGRLWETCMTMNDTWGFAKNDTNWKSSTDLIRKLCDIASKGGNFLLNVGPTAEGEFPQASVERLADVGAWLRVNGASIHGTSQGPLAKLPFEGRCTQKGNRVFLQVFEWPEGGLPLPPELAAASAARTLDGGRKLGITRKAEGVTIEKPRKLDPHATVIELRIPSPSDK